jgi:lipoate-protein ligase B
LDPELELRWLGRVPYAEALRLQESLRDRLLEGRGGEVVLLVEHPDVITFGRGALLSSAHLDDQALRRAGYEVARVNRGGDVTWHGPGQLVGYPILDLSRRGCDVHAYLRALERALCEALADFGIAARRRERYTGVWLDERRKIASIGIGLRRWATLHGFALNVSCDLARFGVITPCGLEGVEMTSMERAAGRSFPADAVRDRVGIHLRKELAA